MAERNACRLIAANGATLAVVKDSIALIALSGATPKVAKDTIILITTALELSIQVQEKIAAVFKEPLKKMS